MIREPEAPSTAAYAYSRYFRVDNRSRRWGLFVTTCGESRTRPHSVYPPLDHPSAYNFNWQHGRRLKDCQIVYISEGAGVIETESNAYRVRAGDALLLTPGLWHRYKPEETTGWHEYWVGFDGSTIRQILGSRFFPARSVVTPIRGERAMLDSFHHLFMVEQERGPGYQQELAARAGMLLAQLFASTQPLLVKEAGMAKSIDQARQILTDEKTRDMPLGKIAKGLSISYSTLRRSFRENTGMSLHQYRLHLKVSSARELLRSTDLRVKEIGYRCGFNDEQYFCRLFKMQTGITPGEFRLQSAASSKRTKRVRNQSD